MGLCSISPGNKWKAAAADEGEGGGAAQGGGGGTEGVTANPPSTGDIQSPEFRIASLPLILLPPPSFPFRPEPIVGLGAKHFYFPLFSISFLTQASFQESFQPATRPPTPSPNQGHSLPYDEIPIFPPIDAPNWSNFHQNNSKNRLSLSPSLPPSHPPLPICRSQSEAATCSGRLIGGCRDWEMRDVTIHRHPPPPWLDPGAWRHTTPEAHMAPPAPPIATTHDHQRAN